MHYIVTTEKSHYEACVDLEAVILRLGFRILHRHDLGAPGGGELACDEEDTVFSLDSARYAERLLAADMRSLLALPWRIAVYTEAGDTRIGLLRPAPLLAALASRAGAAGAAQEIEEKLVQMVDEAR